METPFISFGKHDPKLIIDLAHIQSLSCIFMYIHLFIPWYKNIRIYSILKDANRLEHNVAIISSIKMLP